ncbi:glutaredoxin family protein [Brevibacillus sp. SYSU BS000544]|uniref:glutaredoxin family protein n=1 Tax=Brevibacillus sp. SYSU BS000544 TaxID=3416443 RepID=UPI003CE5689B
MERLPFQIVLYGRPGCHLCDDVEKLIKRVGREFPLILTLVDITGDDELHQKHMFTIPVVAIDGEEVFPSVTSVVTEYEFREELTRRARLFA